MLRVLSVGQCVPDNGTLRGFLTGRWPVEFLTADQLDDAVRCLGDRSVDLVLVNRKLDVDYSDGMEIIRALKADPETARVPVMLVSNYPEHQAEAVMVGALPGFGKLEYGKPETATRLAAVLGPAIR
jgi:response regulator RpfG family c-di-GMP phosphodiesterase